MRTIITCLYITASFVALAQSPGGVAGHVSWVKPLSVQEVKGTEINHNAVGNNGKTHKTLALPSQKSLLAGVTFFCVSMSDTLKERALWRLSTDSATHVVMTNRRMAGLDEFRYINFQDKPSHTPQISTYSRKRALTDTLNEKTLVHIGTIGKDKIPVRDFNGVLPEYVLYNRVLSFHERTRVESYLAIKYGISLNQTYPTSYLDARGKIIWDAQKFSSYAGSIAGIGRDDLSGLMQLKSGSSETPGMLEMEVPQLSDGDFLVWGDNGQPLTFVRKRGEVTKLRRGWVAATTGRIKDKPTTVYFHDSYLEEMHPLAEDEIFWLAIDHKGKGTFPVGQSSYYAGHSKITGLQKFGEISWDLDGNGYDYFSLVAAPEMFVAADVVPPACSPHRQGGLTAEIVGGEAPFLVQLIKGGGEVAREKADRRIFTFDNLTQGNYQLLVSDARNRTWKQAFLLANSDMEQLAAFEPVSLRTGSSVVLDGSRGLGTPSDYFFKWQKPGGETVHTPVLQVDEAGVYLLSVTNGEGCSTLREAEVRLLPDEFFKYVEVSPNPAVQKQATLKVQLVQTGTIKVYITSPTGHIVSMEEFSGSSYYSIKCRFREKGMWLVTVESNGDRRTLKVLVD